jgi:hypothetical protein
MRFRLAARHPDDLTGLCCGWHAAQRWGGRVARAGGSVSANHVVKRCLESSPSVLTAPCRSTPSYVSFSPALEAALASGHGDVCQRAREDIPNVSGSCLPLLHAQPMKLGTDWWDCDAVSCQAQADPLGPCTHKQHGGSIRCWRRYRLLWRISRSVGRRSARCEDLAEDHPHSRYDLLSRICPLPILARGRTGPMRATDNDNPTRTQSVENFGDTHSRLSARRSMISEPSHSSTCVTFR